MSQVQSTWCVPATVQMILVIHGRASTSKAFQAEVAGRVNEWSSWADSHDGGWGPTALAAALRAYGVAGYGVVTYATRAGALRGAAIALSKTRAPVVLLVWRGAHVWVMTGYRANANPVAFSDAAVTGVYSMDPWYPRVSSIWGASSAPGTFESSSELNRNFLSWKRPEGAYPSRDDRFIVVAPTVALR